MTYDVLVIGAGPAGYVCAIRCAQLGLKTAVVEKESLGGVCLNVGCIPSKALIAASKLVHKIQHADLMGIKAKFEGLDLPALVGWKAGIVNKLTSGVGGLLKNHKVDVVMGDAKFVAKNKVEVTAKDGKKTIEAKNIVVAVGSTPIEVPGFAFDGQSVWSSTDALAPKQLPKRMIVIGGGYIGLELGLVYHKLGTEVRVLEFMDRVLPGMEAELSKEMGRSLKKKKIDVVLKAKATGFKKVKGGLQVTAEVEGKAETFECDVVLSCVGRRPSGKGLGLEAIGVKVDDRGFVGVDHKRMTNVPGIYAIGDVAGQPMLAHKGSHEGLIAAAAIAGDKGAAYDPACIPAVIFTDPEIASVGLSVEEAKAAGFDPVEGKFPFGASGRAMSLNETDGWVKVVGDAKTDKLLGVHMIGPEVTELVAEAALAIEMGATVNDLAQTIHAHPTLPEAMMEAAEAVHNMAVHIFQAPKKH
ncbi:MAG: dihydrolipoyl dehydrogenase [Planctomycetes bacterium]|nr:dihydrolipoyl dehydrogenase [Planctomycetota bacterium]MCB9885773.1 dihydrolipoyl dehydrogenase [Planctomycetota bacterium]